MNSKTDEVLQINQAFYDAFAAGDYLAIEKLWATMDEVTVIHPGSAVLHGRESVMMSWRQILANSGGSQVHCADPEAFILGETAYVVCTEVFPEGQLIATNIFILENGVWRMVHHQAGPQNLISTRPSEKNTFLH